MKLKGRIIKLLLCLLLFTLTTFAEEENLVTITLFESDIREALTEISLQTGITIIPDQTVGGVTTVDLIDEPFERALKKILVGGGYTFKKIDDFYFVGLPNPKSSTFNELSTVEIIALKNIYAEEIYSLLPDYYNQYVKVNPKSPNYLSIFGPVSIIDDIKKIVKELDIPKKMLEIKVLVTEINKDKVREFGNSFLEYEQLSSSEIKQNSGSYDFDSGLLVLDIDIHGDLLANLLLLEQEQDASIKANPKLLVTEGEKATLFVGETETFILQDDDDDDSSVEEVTSGVNVEVTAYIRDGKIELIINPKVSYFVDVDSSNLTVKENSVSTTVEIENGGTAVIAGMTLEDESKQDSGIPILGKIPLIRWLFMNRKTSKSTKELLMFVTPVIVDSRE